jgi:hypothetical protein
MPVTANKHQSMKQIFSELSEGANPANTLRQDSNNFLLFKLFVTLGKLMKSDLGLMKGLAAKEAVLGVGTQ